ncbi:MAG: DUF4276 family protein [Thermoflexibacter sp.]|jgi:hypothetical protein|nr:DUF4276 family protein [Thermoflexibacter sp.]
MATKKVKIILFVEGDNDTSNGDLRQGFEKLLLNTKKLEGKLPRIKLGGGKKQTIDAFLNNRISEERAMLVDLDGNESLKEKDLKTYGLEKHENEIFYMIQEMESWFLSQSSVLDEFYGLDNNKKKISEKLPKRNPMEIPSPDKELEKLTINTKKKMYHKVRHGVELLKLLDAKKLMQDFPDFKNLVDYLAGI